MQCVYELQMFFDDPSTDEYMGSLRANFNAIVKLDRGETFLDSNPHLVKGTSHGHACRLRDLCAQKMQNL